MRFEVTDAKNFRRAIEVVKRSIPDACFEALEDAVRLREYLEGREGAELTVAGGFHGIQLLDALDRLGVKARLLSQGNPFLEHFDPDMAGIALERAGITLTDEPGGTVVCFGMEAPRVPGWINGGRPLPVDYSMRYDRRVYALGPVARIRDTVSGRMFSHLSDELSIRQGMAAALSVAGHPVRIRFTKLAVARFSGTLFASCGLTSAEARAAGMDPAVTRVAFGEGPGRSYLKLVADRREGRLVGAQFVGDPARRHLVEMVYGFVVLGREVGDLLSAVDLIGPDTPAPLYGPLGKAVHALWRKMLPE